jgi:type I restriction enzyme S subunit
MAREDWLETTIGEQATLQRGIDITKAEQRVGRVPVISSGGISSYHDTAAVKGPGVVLGRKGVVGSVYFIEEDYWPHDTTLWVKDFHGNHPRFVYYFFKSIAPRLAQMDVGSANPTLNRNHVHPIRISWPPLAEQKAIARILGTLDDKIELNRRMNATLEAMARALFQSWFVDFDPVHAKAAGRQPSGIDAKTAAVFPSSFDADDLPEGWRLGTVNELCEINSWTLGKKDELDELEYVEISEVSRGDIANISTYNRGEEPSRARRRLRHGDTAMSTVRPDRGSYFLALDPPAHRVASTGFAVVTPKKAPWSFVHIALTQPEVFERLGQLADGGAYPAVRPEVIGDLKLPVPDRPEILTAFHETCGPLLEQAEANRTQSRTLATLRDTLLPKLLSGEVSAGTDKYAMIATPQTV